MTVNAYDGVRGALMIVRGFDGTLPKYCGAGGRVYLVEEQANPSSDYFVLPALQASGAGVVRCGFADLPARHELIGAAVVFVRYIPASWARLIEQARGGLASLVFFMDDDLLDVRASVGMPWRYRLKLVRLAARWKCWLQRQGAELWVSTPWLRQKYVAWRPRLIEPVPLPQPENVCRVFYHGSASHLAEVRWLWPVMEEALQRIETLSFEIIGGREVWRLYRDLPRVSVVHPMKWPAYEAFLAMPGRHIGLAPLLKLPFNRARACTKFYDITRCGAVGIYSRGDPCDAFVRHESEGLVVSMEGKTWVEAIVQLARDSGLRQQMYRNALARQVELGEVSMRDTAMGFERGENT